MKELILLLMVAIAFGVDPIFLDEKMKTGYIDVGRGELFYWYFEARNNPETAPVLMWLTGGPGCSSSVALFFENGPYTINKDKTLKKNPYSWNERANVLFMDQPVGTGFSKAKNYVVNEEQVSEDMSKFLVKFFEQNPQLKGRKFFISGESYAGHYIPAIGAYLAKHNPEINLQGLAIGNGLVSPLAQYPAYSDFAHENGKLFLVTWALTKLGFYVCQGLIYTNLWPLAMMECQINLMLIMGPSFYPFFNPYDIRLPCDSPPLCYDFSLVDGFLARKDVREKIGVGDKSYTNCDMIVHTFLLADWWFDFAPDVAYVLDKKRVPVMVYSGDQDFVCNWKGGEAWTLDFDWSGKSSFQKQPYRELSYNAQIWGHIRSYGLLSFVRVLNAGHMAPMDKPEQTLHMINKFMFEGMKE